MAKPARPRGGVPKVISHYRVGRLLGDGGMGEVYLATDRRDGSTVAVKLLHLHLADDEAFRERFEREAHVGALLRSPYTVHLLDHGISQGRYFIVMEYVEGASLKEEIRGRPLEVDRALRIAAQAARALEEAEARGVIHRDIKPDNIFIGAGDSVKVGDFGIARQVGGGTLTTPGALVGTLAYAAPELALGKADHRSDIYSLGATLYHILTGRPPFQGDALEVLRHHQETPLRLEPLAGLPVDVTEIITRCLEKDPRKRYQTASALAGALEHAAVPLSAVETETPTEIVTPPGGDVAEGVPVDTGAVTQVVQPLASPPEEAALTEVKPREKPPATGLLPVAIELGPAKGGGSLRPSRFALTLRNGGDQPADVRLEAADGEGRCAFSLPKSVSVPAGVAKTVSVVVRPRSRRWRGERKLREFTVSASAAGGGPPATATGSFEDVPYGWLPAGVLMAIGIVPAAAIGAALLLGGDGDDGGRPASSLTSDDLSQIVLSKGDLGPDYVSFSPDADSFGDITNDARASAACESEAEARQIEDAGRVGGYGSAYISEEVRSAKQGAFLIETSVEQYLDASGAVSDLDAAMSDPAGGVGQPECRHVGAFEKFEPGDIGDGAAGVEIKMDTAGGSYSLTIVGFTREALVGKVVISHFGSVSYREHAAVLARRMDERMRQALERDIVAARTPRPSRTGLAVETKATPTPSGSAQASVTPTPGGAQATPKPAAGGQTNPPVTQKPVSTPKVTVPPVTNPPVTNPPVTNPPPTQPPPTSPPEFLLYADFVSVPTGGTVTVNVWVDAPSPGLGYYDIDLDYDLLLVSADWCSPGAGASCDVYDGTVNFYGYSGFVGDSIYIGSIEFQAGFVTGASELYFYVYEMEDVNGTDITAYTIELGGEVDVY